MNPPRGVFSRFSKFSDSVNPLVVLDLRMSCRTRIATGILYLVMLGVFSMSAFQFASAVPQIVFEAVFFGIVYLTLYFLTLRTITGFTAFWKDDAIELASKAIPPLRRFHGKCFPFFFDGLWVWVITLPFIFLVSTAGFSFWWFLESATALCLVMGAFVMMGLLFSVNDRKPEKGDWVFIIPMTLAVASTLFGLFVFMEGFAIAPLFFMVVLSLYCMIAYTLCRVHLRWNLKHPYREAIVNASVFGPFGIAVFVVGYFLFG